MFKEILNTIRESATSEVWSQGVLLARHGGVVGEERDEDEIILRVSRDNSPMCFNVSVWPEDEDWPKPLAFLAGTKDDFVDLNGMDRATGEGAALTLV